MKALISKPIVLIGIVLYSSYLVVLIVLVAILK